MEICWATSFNFCIFSWHLYNIRHHRTPLFYVIRSLHKKEWDFVYPQKQTSKAISLKRKKTKYIPLSTFFLFVCLFRSTSSLGGKVEPEPFSSLDWTWVWGTWIYRQTCIVDVSDRLFNQRGRRRVYRRQTRGTFIQLIPWWKTISTCFSIFETSNSYNIIRRVLKRDI